MTMETVTLPSHQQRFDRRRCFLQPRQEAFDHLFGGDAVDMRTHVDGRDDGAVIAANRHRDRAESRLGLAISAYVMQMLEGRISYRRDPERGACFVVAIPRAK